MKEPANQDRWRQAQDAEAQYWAGAAGNIYQALFELTEHCRQAALRLPELLEGKTGLAAIEIGVGPMGIGFLPVYAAGHCERIVGVEPLPIQPPAIPDQALSDYLQALRQRVEIVQAKAEQLPFEPATFDLACCINVLDHTDSPPAILAELARVVRPGGSLVLAVHTRSSLGMRKWRIDRRRHTQELFYRAHPYAFTFNAMQARLRRDWLTLWCYRPSLCRRAIGHQTMSTWILRRR